MDAHYLSRRLFGGDKNGIKIMKKPKSNRSVGFKHSYLAWFISCQLTAMLGGMGTANAEEYFSPALLEIDNPMQGNADLSIFRQSGNQPPGIYRVDIYLNGTMITTQDVDFSLSTDAAGNQSLQPCLNAEMLKELGVKVALYPTISTTQECVNFRQDIPQSSARFDFEQQRLDLSLPQASLNLQARGYVSPDKWDAGIPALLMNYNFTGATQQIENSSRQQDGEDYYLNLRTGINLADWRLRNYSTWSRDSDGNNRWKSINTYMQRDIKVLKSQLVLGDSTSPSEVFDSVSFRGAQVASDDDMLPDSMKGYSPVVRGIARSNAQVTIRQNGYVIYQSYVAPGPFNISDLYPTSGSGDLQVTVKEADGSEQNLVVPFAAVPVLQREGRLKYSLTSGQYRSSSSDAEKTLFSQGTAIYGMRYGATAYGGIQAASKYQALVAGLGQNLGRIGALSADVTQAWTTRRDTPKTSGQSYRLRYGKSFVDTGTNFSLASYRYSTAGFYTLQEALDSYHSGNNYSTDQKKNRFELTMSQNLWQQGGAISISMVKEKYWNNNRSTESIGVGYNNTWSGISYGLNYTYSKNGLDSFGARTLYTDQIFALNISVPLNKWLAGGYATYGMSSSKKGNTTQNVGLSGTALADDNLNYNLTQGYGSQGQGSSGSAAVDYKGGKGELNVGYSYDKNQRRLNYGLEGGAVVHENGLTLSQPLSETMVLVKAPGAGNVRVTGNSGVKTDGRGYAVVPYATPYRNNQILLDTQTLPDDVDITMSSTSVIPARGAVARADFNPRVGQRVLMTLTRSNGQPVPFGAMVSDLNNKSYSGNIVGDDGQVYLTGMSDSGRLGVKWGNGPSQSCEVDYRLPKSIEATSIELLKGECR
jgi:outer membrane usher protein